MPTSDERLKLRVNRAITLQEQGQFVVDTNQELPLLHLPDLRYSTARDELGRYFDFETNWGKFRYDPESYRTVLVLCKGNPPAELLPQPRLELATATVHTGYVSIHNNGRSFDLDFQTRDKVGWDTIRLINKTLAAEQIPAAVWQVDEDGDICNFTFYKGYFRVILYFPVKPLLIKAGGFLCPCKISLLLHQGTVP